jgi:outer-membrane receptor for ferric coprogen and ferric-rhodotorulic acid
MGHRNSGDFGARPLSGRLTTGLLASATACFSTALFAQDASTGTQLGKVVVEAEEESPYTVEGSESATKLPLTLRETPQSVTVVTRERLDDQNLQSLREVLDITPGVYSYAYDSERVLFTSRGFVIDNLLYDGVPATVNFNTDSIDETLDTALYERIEIVRGATGLMTGAGSPAASVNLVRKRANSKELQVALDLTAGSWSDRRVEADVSTPLTSSGNVRMRAVGVYQDRDSYQAMYEKQKNVFYGVIDADLTPSTLLSVGYDYQDNRPRSNTWGSFPLYLADGTPADWSRSVSTATDWAFWNRRKETIFAELRQDFGNEWSLRSSVTWRRFREDLALFYVYGFPDPVTGEGLEPFASRSDGQITERALDLYASGPFSLFGREHELVVGYNGSRISNDGVEYAHGELAPTGNFFEWDGSYPEPEFDAQGLRTTDISTRQNAFYAAARLVLADPLKLIAGARFNSWKTDSFYIYDAPEPLRYDFNKTIPYAGLVYDISTSFSVFTSFTEIFKPQNKRDVNVAFLDPVEGRSYEAGIKGEHLDGRFNTALTVFETRQNNVAAPAVDDETGLPVLLPDGTQASRAIDGTRTRGFELEASGTLREGWNASLGWSRYNTKDANDEVIRTFAPRTLVKLFTTWKAPGVLSSLTVGGGVNWQSDSYTFVGSPDGGTTLRQGSVALLSLMARYQFTPDISAQFTGNNLLDRRYYVLDEYDNTYFGAPASYSLGVNVKF